MDGGLFGVLFLFLGYKNGAAAPVDYSSTFATAPSVYWNLCDWNQRCGCVLIFVFGKKIFFKILVNYF